MVLWSFFIGVQLRHLRASAFSSAFRRLEKGVSAKKDNLQNEPKMKKPEVAVVT
jgi:hypothetical protein